MNITRSKLLTSLCVVLCLGLLAPTVWSVYQTATTTAEVGKRASELVSSLNDDQRELAVLPYDSEKRVDWHFIPMDTRKGLMLRDMTEEQREQAYKLLQACLSEAGYEKARRIMNLEKLLLALEGEGSRFRRDYLKYYFSFFGDPRQENRWGLSVEGHHLSLNFVFEDDRMIASTPQFFAANPAIIKSENDLGIELESEVLMQEQKLAFQLINQMNDEQRQLAIIDAKCPRDIRGPVGTHPPQEPPAGLPASRMNADQCQILRALIAEYAQAIPPKLAALRLKQIEEDGFENVHFAWAGATKPGIGHYYRIQADSFLIEFVNTQPDAAGNPANHIHSVWRDMRGDFALSAN